MVVNIPEESNSRATLELLFHISRELTTALDLPTVLQRVLFLAMKNIGAISGSIIVLDDNGQPIESAMIYGAQLHDQTTQQLRITLDNGLAGWVVNHRQAVLISDTSQDERWLKRPDDSAARTGTKSVIAAPLLAREQIVGVVTLVRPHPGIFTMEHLELVQAIAGQAGIAVLNARLYEESQRQANVMTALAETSATINATLNQEGVLQRIVDQISQALRVQAASLALIIPTSNILEFKAAAGWMNANAVGAHLEIGRGIAGIVAREGKALIVSRTRQDERFDPETDERIGFRAQAVACAPIRLQDQVIGVLEAINPENGKFGSEALLVLSGIGNLAGTAIRHAQLFESLDAAHQRYRDLFEASIDPILITDLDGYILEANRQAVIVSGYSTDDLRDMKIDELHDLEQKQSDSNFEYPGLSDNALSYESTLITKDAENIPVQVYARSVNFDGIRHIQWTLRDISERKNLDNLRDDLVSMIYHDLRSPLANVVSSLDVLNSFIPDNLDPSIKSILRIAERSTERIQRLTNSLLDVNRLKAGQKIITQTPVQLNDVVRYAVEAADLMAVSKEQTIEVEIPPDLPKINVDEDMIRRVLINLMENAIKYTPTAGTIKIGADQQGNWVQIWVSDTGRGIPEGEHERIFNKFARLRSREDDRKGLGLGLTFCRLAVEGHGGRIWVESEVDKGSRFTFCVPVDVDVQDSQRNNR